jgi:hypothetical protein
MHCNVGLLDHLVGAGKSDGGNPMTSTAFTIAIGWNLVG